MTSGKVVLNKVNWIKDFILNSQIVTLSPWASQITILNKTEIMGNLR